MTSRKQLVLGIGKKGLRLAIDIITQTIFIAGVRGSGKTVTATVIAEEVLKAGIPLVIIDPTDVWWGLKSSLDGKKEGFDVLVLGGGHSDLPLEEGNGRVIADFVVDQRVPVVLSIRHMRKNKQRQFVTEFLEQLYHRKGETNKRQPLMVVIDEASTFVPQRVSGDVSRMVGAVEDLVRRGRASGFGVVLVDQRPASVNKDVLTQLQMIICHQITAPQDRKALDEWIQQHDTEDRRQQFNDDLSHLNRGEAYVWMPSSSLFQREQIRMRETFDSSKTPSLGEVVAEPTSMAMLDLDSLRDALAGTIERAQANDPKILQARIRELEREALNKDSDPNFISLTAAENLASDRVMSERATYYERMEEMERHVRVLITSGERVLELTKLGLGAATAPGLNMRATAPQPGGPPPSREVFKKAPKSAPTKAVLSNGAVGVELKGPQKKVLNALATYASFGQNQVARVALAALAGYKAGGHFNNTVGSLFTLGLIEYPSGGWVALTPAGRDLGVGLAIHSVTDLHDAWMNLLKGPQQKLLQELLNVYPLPMPREELAERTGYSPGGHFNNTVGSLKTFGAVVYPGKGLVCASDLMFPDGLR